VEMLLLVTSIFRLVNKLDMAGCRMAGHSSFGFGGLDDTWSDPGFLIES